MSVGESTTTQSLAHPDTNNATIIAWSKKTPDGRYDPDDTWDDDRYPRRYGDYYKDLDLTNNGYKNYDWWNRAFYRWLEGTRIIETCAAQLELTSRECGHAETLFHRLSGRKFGTYRETYAIGACLYVVEQDDKDTRRSHPNVSPEEQPPEFRLENVSSRFGVDKARLRTAYGRIEYWIRVGELEEESVYDRYREDTPIEYEHNLIDGCHQYLENNP